MLRACILHKVMVCALVRCYCIKYVQLCHKDRNELIYHWVWLWCAVLRTAPVTSLYMFYHKNNNKFCCACWQRGTLFSPQGSFQHRHGPFPKGLIKVGFRLWCVLLWAAHISNLTSFSNRDYNKIIWPGLRLWCALLRSAIIPSLFQV